MLEPTLEAESGWVETIRATAIDNLAFRQACTGARRMTSDSYSKAAPAVLCMPMSMRRWSIARFQMPAMT
jgi:hypothetical protein